MSDGQRVIVTGGTGFIGRALCQVLVDKHDEVIVLTRSVQNARQILGDRVVVKQWDGASPEPVADLLNKQASIINLVGENIGSGRWSAAKLKRIIGSRVSAGKAITEAIRSSTQKPAVLVQASGIGYYGNQGEVLLDEKSQPKPSILTDIAAQWEQSVAAIPDMGVRVAIFRLGVVLAGHGGFLSRVMLPFKLFMGGHQGSGEQWISWIHLNDVVNGILYLLKDSRLSGVFNLTSNSPVKAREFYRTLGDVMNRPSWLHVPGFAMRLLLGKMADELILTGQRAVPKRMLEAGFQFQFGDLKQALTHALSEETSVKIK